MFPHCNLAVLMLVLTLHGQVHTGEIIGGHEVVPHSRPYMVLLERKTRNNRKNHCGGILLSKDFVMTAAHCEAESYNAILGVHNFHNKDEKRQNISVEQAFLHPNYTQNVKLTDDMMLLKLNSRAELNNNVKPVMLADQCGDLVPKSCIVSGWGQAQRENTMMSITLMEVNVTLIDDEQCPKDKYCSEGENGPGKGDSGGPLVCEDGKVYGVVSGDFNRASYLLYSYTKVPDNRKWIDDIMTHNGNNY
ncbi:mast cell protease 2-like [Odontesthes bonariensis]|uniref:mast cell protease 2-like n=1 Tax=Odontesthes bonariensis TaxID=219752 RepID=UPI003F58C0E8